MPKSPQLQRPEVEEEKEEKFAPLLLLAAIPASVKGAGGGCFGVML